MRRFVLPSAVLLALAAGAAHAGVQTFTDRSAWLAAIGKPIDFTVDFNGFTQDTQAPLNLGPFDLIPSGTNSAFIDAPPLNTSDPTPDGTAHAFIFVEFNDVVTSTFLHAVTAFGGDFAYAGNTIELSIDLITAGGTTTVHVPGPGTTLTFFGFVSTEEVTMIRYHNDVNDGFLLDNVSGAYPTTTPARSVSWGRLKARYR